MTDKVIVAGSRSIERYRTVELAVRANYPSDSRPERWDVEIVHGGADGVDTLASRFADDYGLDETVFEPDWDDIDHPEAVVREGEYGKYNAAAGPIRNGEMAEHGDMLVAVWDGESSGTRSMIEKALDEGLDVHVEVVDD